MIHVKYMFFASLLHPKSIWLIGLKGRWAVSAKQWPIPIRSMYGTRIMIAAEKWEHISGFPIHYTEHLYSILLVCIIDITKQQRCECFPHPAKWQWQISHHDICMRVRLYAYLHNKDAIALNRNPIRFNRFSSSDRRPSIRASNSDSGNRSNSSNSSTGGDDGKWTNLCRGVVHSYGCCSRNSISKRRLHVYSIMYFASRAIVQQIGIFTSEVAH